MDGGEMCVWILMVGGWRDVCLDINGWWVGGDMYIWI